MAAYWVGVASREHVLRGVQGSFCQVCHGKETPLKRMRGGDWIIYYSPVERFGLKEPCQRFTAIGKLVAKDPYQYRMAENFIPWRRDVEFLLCKEASIKPLIEKLSFIHDKQSWGYPFRWGCFSISEEDFKVVAEAMGVHV